MKMLELKDEVSMLQNRMQTLTKEIIRVGTISNSGIKIEYLREEEALVTCKVNNDSTSIFLTAEPRLPFGCSRQEMINDGFGFLLEENNKLVENLNDDDNEVNYILKNVFHDAYSENPMRDMLKSSGLECKLNLYYPTNEAKNNVDGIAVIEIGYNLKYNSGLLFYFNFRNIPNNEVSYLQ